MIGLLSCGLCFCSTGLLAQGKAGAQKGGGNANGAAAANAGGGEAAAKGGAEASPSESATSSALDYLFNRKAKDGSTVDKGSAIADAIGTQALADEALDGVSVKIDPEFESFLNAPEHHQDLVDAYKEMLDGTVQHLRDRQAYDAIANLYVLSRYSWDASISEQLANRVMALRDARMSQQQLEKDNRELEEKIRNANYNADQLADSVRKQEIEFQRKQSFQSRRAAQQAEKQNGNSNNNSKNSAFLPNPEVSQQAVSSVMGRLQLSEEYFRSLDSRARVRLNEKEMEAIEKKARADFQDFVGILYEGQRHHHARLAADFYRVLFGDGDLPTEMASQATAASEIINRIENDVEVFKFKARKGQMAGATSILQEAFSISKNHPALRLVNREEKLLVADYLADLQKLHNMVEARDFGNLELALARLEENVSDFDATKPRSLVNAVKRESDMRLGMAKLSAQQGNLEKALEEFKAASEAWPDNPRLEEASNEFFTSQDVMNQSNDEFDRAYKAEDYRAIFENQVGFAVAVRGDADREDQLRESLEIVKAAELALEKAKLLERNRDPFGAWESVELAAEDWPEDPELNRRRADLAIRASEFVSAISKARDAEVVGDYGFGLTWYINAQTRYPASQLANEGISRLTNRVLGRAVVEEAPEAETEETPPEPAATESEGSGNEEA
ncbi:MAG: hypothetical protein HRU46_12520 [Verrucomicrobiales bacterium]|nr:hypothetical protein [Verrucomicrobiales bacterium]